MRKSGKWLVRNWLDVVVILTSLLSGVTAILMANDVLVLSGWKAATPALITAFGLTAMGVDRMIGRSTAERTAKTYKACFPLFALAVINIAELGNVSVKILGGSVYRIRRRLPFTTGRLHRVLRFPLANTPPESDIRWKRQKGCIGMVLKDRRHHYEAWSNAEREAQRDGHYKYDRDSEVAFTAEDRQALLDHYAEVLAWPICDPKGALIGVISIDRPASGWNDEAPNVLESDGAREIAQLAASQLSPHVARR